MDGNCVVCGAYTPEGTIVCSLCYKPEKCTLCGKKLYNLKDVLCGDCGDKYYSSYNGGSITYMGKPANKSFSKEIRVKIPKKIKEKFSKKR